VRDDLSGGDATALARSVSPQLALAIGGSLVIATGVAWAWRAHHAIYCMGCCASLMVVLLVVGMMDLAWMVGLTAVIYLEKVVPTGGLVSRIAGLALCAVGLRRLLA
jgi:predicted metal-binding membrane protein